MPELPEVESVKRKISPYLVGHKILKVETYYHKYNVLESIKNETINNIKRLGKFLIFELDNFYMISHLRMEGKYQIRDNETKNKHDLVFFYLDDHILSYNDKRKFGVFYLFDKSIDIYKVEPLVKLGKEPFVLDYKDFYNSLKNKNKEIKTLLLDQSIIAGIGNIYADEILYKSKINPYKKGKDINEEETKTIIDNSIIILNQAIIDGGSTVSSFESFNHEVGSFQENLKVYNKEFKRCERCNSFIIKNKLNGRGTSFCPACQSGKKIIAITGSISSGKSAVLSEISRLGYSTYSLDDIYKKLLDTSKDMNRELKKAFNTNDKLLIKEIIKNDKSKNDLLKDITHKYIMKEFYNEVLLDESDTIFVEVPLLFESKLENSFYKTILVYPSDEVENKLYEIRGLKKEDINMFLDIQLSKDDKKRLASYIIYNDGDIVLLYNRVKELINLMEEKDGIFSNKR